MTDEQWQRAEELFEAARKVPAANRESIVTAEASGDEELAREVLSLLAHAGDGNDGFLAAPPPDPRIAELFNASETADLIGSKIGRYTIRRVIASGGMGAVYLADQDRPKREVALKILHVGFSSRSLERRFEFESQVLARLQHPNIAQVFEAGTADFERTGHNRGVRVAQVHFFAMEYVPNAQPITRFAAEEQPSLRQRLELFLQVCAAVSHGHQRGIIHRDLKPANILVAKSASHAGVPAAVKVIDFGVARCTDADVAATTMHTETGQLIGTLAYMSPEQCDADPLGLDVRSDIYSLGVLLYELLCGRMPYDVSRTSVYSAVKTIREAIPVRPSAVLRPGTGPQWLERDLEAIVLRTIEKEKHKRYASVPDLASDIRSYLTGDPITARPPTAWTRVTRWAARHPASATVALCAAIAAIAIATTTAGIYIANIRPFALEYSGTRDSVFLTSYGGRRLHEWDSHVAGGAIFADAKFPTDSRGHRLAIIGFNEGSNIFPGQLCAFDVDTDRREPCWTRSIEIEKDGPPFLKAMDRSRWRFGVKHTILADVFSESRSPGPEIIAIFAHPYSRRCVRIYDLDGKRLCEFWQDGGLLRPHWMAQPGLLVFVGGDEREKRGDVQFAPVVFAIQPQLDFISHADPSQSSLSIGLQPSWYRYLLPPIFGNPPEYEMENLELLADTGSYNPEAHVCLTPTIHSAVDPNCRAGVRILLDEHGNEVPKARGRSDGYRQNRHCLPSEDSFRLSNAPWSQLGETERQQILTTSRPSY